MCDRRDFEQAQRDADHPKQVDAAVKTVHAGKHGNGFARRGDRRPSLLMRLLADIFVK